MLGSLLAPADPLYDVVAMMDCCTVEPVGNNFVLGSVMALGYQGELSDLAERFQGQEQSPRSRKSLSEIVLSAWDRPADLG
jgi:hypothetical protein